LASGDYAQAFENILDSIINKNKQLYTRDTTINQPATTTELIYTSKTESEQKSPSETIPIPPTVLTLAGPPWRGVYSSVFFMLFQMRTMKKNFKTCFT
jgi:hypothetical protein